MIFGCGRYSLRKNKLAGILLLTNYLI
jgi:hypothetical protein